MPARETHGPWRITFDTNPDDCNLDCRMCETHWKARETASEAPRRRMTIDLVRRVLDGAGEELREVIPSTMGEPLLWPHFPDLVTECASRGVALNLTTNGTFPGRGGREWARLVVPVASDVKVSWNGARGETAEAIMQGLRWQAALGELRAFIDVRNQARQASGRGCTITLQMTFMEDNHVELPDIVRMAAELGVDRVKGHHLWVHDPAMARQSMLRNRNSRSRWNAVAREAEGLAHSLPTRWGRPVRLENAGEVPVEASSATGLETFCPFLGREAWIDTTGRFSPCCAPDALRRELGDFGTVLERPLADIWTGARYRDLVMNYRQQPLCGRCPLRRPVEVA